MAGLTQEELIDAAVAKAGNRRKLSKALGLDYNYLTRWRSGEVGIKFETTVALLEYVGWLHAGEGAGPASGHTGGASRARATRPDRLEEPAEELDGVVALLREAADRLTRISDAGRLGPPVRPRASSR